MEIKTGDRGLKEYIIVLLMWECNNLRNLPFSQQVTKIEELLFAQMTRFVQHGTDPESTQIRVAI